jgi:hypothetical protein
MCTVFIGILRVHDDDVYSKKKIVSIMKIFKLSGPKLLMKIYKLSGPKLFTNANYCFDNIKWYIVD